MNTSVKGNTNDINEEGTRVVRGFHLLIHNSLAKARYCRDPNGINPNSWPCPLFETRNPCIRPSANRRIYPTVPLQTFPARARSTRIVEIYPRMRKLREGSTVYDGVVTTASLRPFHSLPYSRRFEEINSRYSREIKIDFVRSELVTIDKRLELQVSKLGYYHDRAREDRGQLWPLEISRLKARKSTERLINDKSLVKFSLIFLNRVRFYTFLDDLLVGEIIYLAKWMSFLCWNKKRIFYIKDGNSKYGIR